MCSGIITERRLRSTSPGSVSTRTCLFLQPLSAFSYSSLAVLPYSQMYRGNKLFGWLLTLFTLFSYAIFSKLVLVYLCKLYAKYVDEILYPTKWNSFWCYVEPADNHGEYFAYIWCNIWYNISQKILLNCEIFHNNHNFQIQNGLLTEAILFLDWYNEGGYKKNKAAIVDHFSVLFAFHCVFLDVAII